MNPIVDDALNFEKYVHSHGQYQLIKITPNTGIQTIDVSTTGGNETIFEIPAKVFNGGKSFLSFTAAPAPGGVDRYNWINVDGFCYFRQIQMQTKGGTYTTDIPDADKYLNIISRREHKIEDVLTWDKVGGVYEGLIPCNSITTNNIIKRFDNTPLKTNYLEPLYVIQGGNNGANPVANVRFDFDKIKYSLLGLNKDQYYDGETVTVRFVWNPSTKMYFTSPTANDPNDGNVVAAAGNVTITNCILYLAVETNPLIETKIKSQCETAEGFQITFPQVYYNKVNLTAANNHAINLRYGKQQGQRLLKVFWAPYNTQENKNTTYDHTNIAGVKFTSFYTTLDGMRTSQYNYSVANKDDWLAKRESLRGSCILSSDEYYFNWAWVEDFTGPNPKFKDLSVPVENCYDGIDLLEKDRIFDIIAENSGAAVTVSHYCYGVVQRTLLIKQKTINIF